MTFGKSKFIIYKENVGGKMYRLYDLILNSKQFVDYEKYESPFLENCLKLEKELLAKLNESNKKIFEDFKFSFLSHLEDYFVENYDYFLHYGLKIGFEAAQKFNDLD